MPLKKPIYATPRDAEQAMYDAMNRADLEAFMNVWAEDEEIVCILPNGPRIVGYANVRETWRHILEEGQRFTISSTNAHTLPGMLMTVHSVYETIALAERNDGSSVQVLATNIFMRTAVGWRLLVHHASATMSAPDEGIIKTLH